MRILRLEAVNFRTVEQIEVNFQNYYTSICGKNNSGKSNLLRVIRNIFIDSEFAIFFGPGMRFAREIDIEKDFTNWKSKEKSEISICVEIEINSKFDSGLYKFIEEFILKNESSDKDENACLKISISWKYPERKNNVEIVYKGEKIEDSYQKDEIIRKIKSINCMIFHNSTSHGGFTYASSGRFDSIYEFLSDEDKAEISKKKDDLFKQMKSRLKKQQKEFATLLGRLEDKYEVSLSFAEPSFERSSINISLKEKGIDVDLDDWGSGTKNRTLIFLKLLNAKKLKETEQNSEKITPFIIIEEPESFLHPSAQAEFGRVMQDIAEELKVQVIVTTHSVYMLNHKKPDSNILLDRTVEMSKLKGTYVVNTEGDKWYEPFALTLGINGNDFGPLKNTIFSQKDEIILVEGETDKKYFELLLDNKHGVNQLQFNGEIFAYGGADQLKNNVLLRFIKGRFSKFLITIDIDRLNDIKRSLESVNFVENIDFIGIGKNDPSKQNIEGLLPSKILSKVYSNYPDLVQLATSNSSDRKSAQSKLKNELFEEFNRSKEYSEDYFGEFYKVVKKINKKFK